MNGSLIATACTSPATTAAAAFEELTPNSFSFNSPLGWCPACEGLGTEQGTESGRSDRRLQAVPIGGGDRGLAESGHRTRCSAGCSRPGPGRSRFRSTSRSTISIRPSSGSCCTARASAGSPSVKRGSGNSNTRDSFPRSEEASRVSYALSAKTARVGRRGPLLLVRRKPTAGRRGQRAVPRSNDPSALLAPVERIAGILEVESKSRLPPSGKIAGDLLNEATSRLSFLVDVGLEYLTLARPLPTLSGGETQRIRLAGQIGRALTGVLYVLDEPTIGLHPRDNNRLLEALRRLRDLGNTVVLVEHDREVLAAADRLYDFGPGAGRFGGTITAEGTPKEVSRASRHRSRASISRAAKEIPIPRSRRMYVRRCRTMSRPAAAGSNSRVRGKTICGDVDLRLPLGTFTCVTGVSGSGKSSLIEDTLARAVAKKLNRATEPPGPHDEIRGLGADQQGDHRRPAAAGEHARLEPGDLHGRFRFDPRAVRPAAGGAGPRIPAGAIQLQSPGGPLRRLRGERPEVHSDALSARRVGRVRNVPRQAL